MRVGQQLAIMKDCQQAKAHRAPHLSAECGSIRLRNGKNVD